jgi:CHAT domain-containing protein
LWRWSRVPLSARITETLSRAILYGGAASCLLTLWDVNAATTVEWMIEYYASTWASMGAKLAEQAHSFRAVTLSLMERYPDPAIWAPCVLIGN